MNKVILMGRLTKEPELAQTQSGTEYVRFTIAVSRRFKDKDGNYQADFINCTAWRKTAEFICRYFGKGSQIAVIGSIQTGSYQKNGETVYTTEVNADEVYFAGSKQESGTNAVSHKPEPNITGSGGYGNALPPPQSTFDDFPEYYGNDEDLPF